MHIYLHLYKIMSTTQKIFSLFNTSILLYSKEIWFNCISLPRTTKKPMRDSIASLKTLVQIINLSPWKQDKWVDSEIPTLPLSLMIRPLVQYIVNFSMECHVNLCFLHLNFLAIHTCKT